MADIELVVPDLGDFDSVEVIEVLVNVGDQIAAEDPVVTLESDKASMEVPASSGGVVTEINVNVGDSVSSGSVLGKVAAEGTSDSTPKSAPEESIQTTEREERAEQGEVIGSSAEATIVIPDLGDFDSVEVIEVLVQPGDRVELDQGVVTLESDKASMEVPAASAGVVLEMLVSVGDQVGAGAPVARLQADATVQKSRTAAPTEVTAPTPPPPPSPAPAPSTAPTKQQPARGASVSLGPIDESKFSSAHASPSVRKLARELGVDLVKVRGSGHKQRITADDVKAFVKAALNAGPATGASLPSVPSVDFAKFGEVSSEPLTRIQKISGPRLHASWVNIPHVTQHDEADVTDLEAARKSLKARATERGIKLTPLAFVVRAVVLTLAQFPRLSSSLAPDGGSLIRKHYCHIGFAADTPNGLVVPVIRDADKKDIYELAASLAELSGKARDGKLTPAEMTGGVFTISSLGGIGGTAFTPVVNAPEVGILGVSKMSTQPVWDGQAFQPRLMLPLSLSYDHRVVDGAEAVRFTTYLTETLANVARLTEAIP